mgnify:CR=1 FL=1
MCCTCTLFLATVGLTAEIKALFAGDYQVRVIELDDPDCKTLLAD